MFTRAAAQLACTEGYRVQVAHTLHEARGFLRHHGASLLVLDLDLPDGSGLEVLDELDMGRHGPVAIVTGKPTLDSARRAVGLPVVEYLVKPLRAEQFQALLRRTMQRHWVDRNRPLSALDRLAGKSSAMRELLETVFRIAASDAPVLLIGEVGTGKELVARALHDASARQGPFVAIGCGTLPRERLAPALFGSGPDSRSGDEARPGVFERAAGGTVLLDDVAELPLHVQAQLLRVVDSGEFMRVGDDAAVRTDVRLILSSTVDPADRIGAGTFREDLYYGISSLPLRLPPLRERGDDVVLLAELFIRRLNAHYGQAKRLAPGADRELLEYPWPGNIRELRGAVQRAYLLQRGEHLRIQPLLRRPSAPARGAGPDIAFAIGDTLAEIERRAVLATLAHYHNDKAAAAKALGVSVRTIYNHLARISGAGEHPEPDPGKAAA